LTVPIRVPETASAGTFGEPAWAERVKPTYDELDADDKCEVAFRWVLYGRGT
jgi:hypothetical protein